MKKLLLIACAFPIIGFAQTITTTGSGDFYSPALWDCTCIPSGGEDMIINHDMTTSVGLYVDGGSLLINSGASVTVNPDAAGVFVSNGASVTNEGTFIMEDVTFSLGTTTITSGIMDADSLLSQGSLSNTGTITVYDIANDEDAVFSNQGRLEISNNFNNQGQFTNEQDITVQNDFSNCNTQFLDAMFVNNGTMCVTNDFANCEGDTLAGTGDFFVGNQSANAGVFTGTFSFHTPSGAVTANTGTVQPTVNVTMGTCTLGVNELTKLNIGLLSAFLEVL